MNTDQITNYQRFVYANENGALHGEIACVRKGNKTGDWAVVISNESTGIHAQHAGQKHRAGSLSECGRIIAKMLETGAKKQ